MFATKGFKIDDLRLNGNPKILIKILKQCENDLNPLSYENYIKNYKRRIRLREINFNSNRNSLESKPKIAQIKAIQKFIGKLKGDNKNYQAILTELQTLNLSKYLEEISSLIASYVSEKQISFYAEISTKLNQEYQDFPAMIIKDLVKNFNLTYESSEDNKSKLKSILLFTTELFVCGFSFPYRQINQMLKKMVKAGTKKKCSYSTEKQIRLFAYFYNCDTYAAFLLHYGSIFTQSVSRWVKRWESEGKEMIKYPQMIPIKTKEDITNVFFTNYISSCFGVLESAFEKIKQIEEELRQNLKMTGEFNKQLENNYNDLRQKFVITKKNLEIIIIATDSAVKIKQYEKDIVDVEQIMKKYINKLENVEIFENEFQKQLYIDIPELVKSETKIVGDEKYQEFKQKLGNCKNKADSDQICKSFEEINNKKTRKMLAKDLLDYRKQYQLVTPFLCRIGAIIFSNWKDIGQYINEQLFCDYEKLRQNINSTFVINDKKNRNLKYICEFAKFKLIDSQKIIGCIQNLIDDLKGHNIELLISTLESVGRFLYLSPTSANKFTFVLSKLENIMKQKSFPLFITSQLLNSISLLKPHIEAPKLQSRIKTEIQEKAEAILSKDIISDLEQMIDEIQKLINSQEGMAAVQNELIIQIQNYNFLDNYNYAYLLQQLNSKQLQDFIFVKTIDNLTESIKSNNYQSSLLWSRFFGQLFKYNLIKRSTLYKNLEFYLSMQGYDLGIINLVCTVLQTCQNYLQSSKIASRNQKFFFLVQFKRFISKCLYVPMLEQFKIIDLYDQLEPNLTSIKIDNLNSFMKENEDKINKKDFDFSKALDLYLDQKNLKDNKKECEEQSIDPRSVTPQTIEPEYIKAQSHLEGLATEAKQFEAEFLNVMNGNMKDFSGRIAKATFVEKVIEKKKEKRKVGQSDKKLVVIGRNGNKFIKKDIILQNGVSVQTTNFDLQDLSK